MTIRARARPLRTQGAADAGALCAHVVLVGHRRLGRDHRVAQGAERVRVAFADAHLEVQVRRRNLHARATELADHLTRGHLIALVHVVAVEVHVAGDDLLRLGRVLDADVDPAHAHPAIPVAADLLGRNAAHAHLAGTVDAREDHRAVGHGAHRLAYGPG